MTTLGALHSNFALRVMTATNARYSSHEITECLNLAIDAAYPIWHLQNVQFASTTSNQQHVVLHSNARDVVSVKMGWSNYPQVNLFDWALAESGSGTLTYTVVLPRVIDAGRTLRIEYQGLHPRLSAFTDNTPVPDAYLLAYAEARAHQMWANAGPEEDQNTHLVLMQQADAEAVALKMQMAEQQKAAQEIRVVPPGRRKKG